MIEALESRRLMSVVTLTSDTTKVLTLTAGETLVGNNHKVGGLTGYDVSNVSVSNLRVVGSKGDGVSMYWDKAGYAGFTLTNVTVSGFTRGTGVILGTGGSGTVSNITLTNVTAYNNGDSGIATYGAKGTLTNVAISYCSAYNNAGIKNSVASGNGIVVGGVDGCSITHCTAYSNGANDNSSSGPVGIWAYDSNAVIISYCKSYNNKTKINDGGGFDLDGGVTNSVIEYCSSSGNVGYGYAAFTYAGGGENANNQIINNISTGDGEGLIYWSNGPTISNLTVSGNQFLKAKSGYAVIGGIGSAYVNLVLANNTYSPGELTWFG